VYNTIQPDQYNGEDLLFIVNPKVYPKQQPALTCLRFSPQVASGSLSTSSYFEHWNAYSQVHKRELRIACRQCEISQYVLVAADKVFDA
jgi:hypothetical protein